MKIELDVRGDIELDRAIKDFGDKTLYRNLPRAMNKAGQMERTALKRAVRSGVPELKAGWINKAIRLFKAKRNDMATAVRISDRKIPLGLLKFREARGGSKYSFRGRAKVHKRAFWVNRVKGKPLAEKKVFERIDSRTTAPIQPAYEKNLADVARRLPAYRTAKRNMYNNFVKELRRLLKLGLR